MRQLRTSDDYKKRAADEEKLTRILNDLVGRVEKQKNKKALQKQQDIIDKELQKLNTVFRSSKTPDKDRSIALASMDALKKRRKTVDQALGRLAKETV